MIDPKVVTSLIQPLKDAVQTTASDGQKNSDDTRHRHTLGWPEVMEEEGLPTRA